MYTISRRESFSDTTFLWAVVAPDVAKSAEPGHFVMQRLHEGSERIPLTVADFDRAADTVTLVVQALERSGWNQTKAATLLGLNRDQIRYRIEKFDLQKPS